MVRVAVEVLQQQDMDKLELGLSRLYQADPAVEVNACSSTILNLVYYLYQIHRGVNIMIFIEYGKKSIWSGLETFIFSTYLSNQNLNVEIIVLAGKMKRNFRLANWLSQLHEGEGDVLSN